VTARDEILSRVRQALGDAPRPSTEVPRDYRTGGAVVAGGPALVDLFADRLLDYRAGVRRCDADGLPAAVAEALSTGLGRRAAGPPAGRPRVVLPEGHDRRWLDALDVEVLVDGGTAFDVATLDDCDAVITSSHLAIAETGTVVLDAAADQGRRALTLVPDVHVCIVHADRIVATVPDAMPLIDPTRPLTWISGPSATSDIELDRVEGVHGPRILEIVICSGRGGRATTPR
jgi:L-lactate dehydrogenase complex protein LldG